MSYSTLFPRIFLTLFEFYCVSSYMYSKSRTQFLTPFEPPFFHCVSSNMLRESHSRVVIGDQTINLTPCQEVPSSRIRRSSGQILLLYYCCACKVHSFCLRFVFHLPLLVCILQDIVPSIFGQKHTF